MAESFPEPLGAKLWLREIAPRLEAGKKEDAIAAELGVDVGYIREMKSVWTTPHATENGPSVFA